MYTIAAPFPKVKVSLPSRQPSSSVVLSLLFFVPGLMGYEHTARRAHPIPHLRGFPFARPLFLQFPGLFSAQRIGTTF
jgi:hypothetical protein